MLSLQHRTIGGSLSSGTTLPFPCILLLNFVFVVYMVMALPMDTPLMMPRKGRELIPAL